MLKEIWHYNMFTLKSEAQEIFKLNCSEGKVLIRNLLNILAERVCVISKELVIEEMYLEKIWDLIKQLVFMPMENDSKTILKNINLDIIVLLSIFHISQVNSLYFTLKNILRIYNEKVFYSFIIS